MRNIRLTLAYDGTRYVGWQMQPNGVSVQSVVEAAILATRLHLLPLAEIEAKLRELAVLVEKTGGAQEREAFALLRAHVDAGSRSSRSPEEAT